MQKSGFLIIIAILVITYLFLSYIHDFNSLKRRNENKLIFYKMEANGILFGFKDESRGSVKVEYIKSDGSYHELPLLPIVYDVNKFNIEVGDSMTKRMNSGSLAFYKKGDASWDYCCSVEVLLPN